MARRKRLELPKDSFRSAVTNGRDLLAGIDGRSLVARRYRDVECTIAQDLGGADQLSEAQLQLIRSAAGLIVLRENLDAATVNGEPIDIGNYCKISNSLNRVLGAIGLRRVSKDVSSLGRASSP
jgi:hypothetical protein